VSALPAPIEDVPSLSSTPAGPGSAMPEHSLRDPATGARTHVEDDSAQPGPKLIIRPVRLPAPSRKDVARRLAQATTVTTKHLAPIAARIARRYPVNDAVIAKALRKIFDDMGGSFAKFGQLIGSSPSLFGEDVAAEFRGTLDNVVPISFDDVKRTIEDELGLPLSHLFLSFDEKPLAAASLAVVHKAVLPDGTTVAVKVLRPGIEYKMAVDLAVMQPLFDFIGRQVAIGIAGELPSLISGLEEQLGEEVDLRNEARSVRWFDHLRVTMGLQRVRVPLPVEGYVSKRVLVMDFIEGVSVDHLDEIEAMGIDPRPLVQECVKAWFATAICTGAFHGDVHAGNLLITSDGELGVLDWGIVGRLDPDTQVFFRRVVEGAMGDESAWVDVWKHAEAIYGPAIQQQLGATDEQMVQMIRMQIEPIFRLPFGEINLTDMLVNADIGKRADDRGPKSSNTFELWKSERRRRRELIASGATETPFDRGMFLLGKQLVYFDRYGKMFLPDVPLMWDRAAFERLLAEPVVPAELPPA